MIRVSFNTSLSLELLTLTFSTSGFLKKIFSLSNEILPSDHEATICGKLRIGHVRVAKRDSEGKIF